MRNAASAKWHFWGPAQVPRQQVCNLHTPKATASGRWRLLPCGTGLSSPVAPNLLLLLASGCLALERGSSQLDTAVVPHSS